MKKIFATIKETDRAIGEITARMDHLAAEMAFGGIEGKYFAELTGIKHSLEGLRLGEKGEKDDTKHDER